MRQYLWLWAVMLAAGCDQDLVPATVDEDRSLPAAEWNGSRFHLVRDGNENGAPMIFLAGGPGNDTRYLQRLGRTCDATWLGTNYELIWWDQRSTGLSRRHAKETLTLEVFRQDLDSLVELVDPEAEGVILVGHSWGGTFAADFADRHPERIHGLVLIEPGELTQTLLEDNPTPSFLDLFSEVVNDFAWGQNFFTLDSHEVTDFYALIAARGAQSYRVNREDPPTRRLGAAVILQNLNDEFYPADFDFTQNLDQLKTEVLVIAGNTPTSDLGADLQRRQLDVFPHATLEVLEGSGHSDVVWADGCVSAGLIQEYLQRIMVHE